MILDNSIYVGHREQEEKKEKEPEGKMKKREKKVRCVALNHAK